ncbi:MAG: hypothetical protein JXJ19_01720 [Elusimicrobia bacterium]|nr:hypothetical protein [Elusimicrobiota bacterium]
MVEKENLILKLKSLREETEKTKNEFDSMISEIKELEVELQDESKLGIPQDYDFGKETFKEAFNKYMSIIEKEIKSLKKIETKIEKLQDIKKKQISQDDLEVEGD